MEKKRQKIYRALPVSHFLSDSHMKSEKGEDLTEKLNKSVYDVYNKIRLSEEEIKIRQLVFERIKKVIETELPLNVRKFGSLQTKLMVCNSDIDVTILLRDDDGKKRKLDDIKKSEVNDILHKVCSVIKKHDLALGHILHLKTARIPIIKITDKVFGIKIDIGVSQADGIRTGEFINSIILKYEGLECLVICLKYFLKSRQLSDAQKGGLVGYAQFLLILNFIQLHPVFQSGCLDIKDNLGTLLMDFFLYYGKFPFSNAVVDVNRVVYSYNESGKIFIQNPISDSPVDNVASRCSNIGFIKDIFLFSYKLMRSVFMQKNAGNKNISDLWMRIDYDELERRKHMVEKYRNLEHFDLLD